MRRSVPILTAFLLALSGNFSIAQLRGAEVGPSLRPRPFTIADSDRAHWAFQPVRSAVAPKGTHPIDHLLQVRLRQAGLNPNPPATPREQVRRAYLDLWGLPPSPEVVAEFERHPTDAAWVALVDRLLGSPNYGERWGRHWLDLVRYAESRGHEFDEDTPGATAYRDYVVRAWDLDLPYDQMVNEHVAGDLVDPPRLHPKTGGNESVIATGFWHLGEWVHSPVDTRKDQADRFDNMLDVFSKTFMGTTLACAR